MKGWNTTMPIYMMICIIIMNTILRLTAGIPTNTFMNHAHIFINILQTFIIAINIVKL